MVRSAKWGAATAVFGGVFLFVSALWAAPALKEIRVPTVIYEGEKIKIRIAFEWPVSEGDPEIKVPENLTGANVEFSGFHRSQETYVLATGDIHRLVLTYTVKPLAKGHSTIHGFDLRYKPPPEQGTQSVLRRDREWKTLAVPPIVFNVRAALPWKKIFMFVAVPLVLVLPFGLWFLHASRVDRKVEKKFLSDPKQQLYASVARELDRLISGYTRDDLQLLLSKWSGSFQNVVATHYGLPLRKRTHAELLADLNLLCIPDAELGEIERVLVRLQGVRFSLDGFDTNRQVEEVRVSMLKYVNGKLIIGKPS
ncbi:MAG: hypothetical protein KTQ49_05720 [Candidatus Omnitrophica bacterium]|nr:hypothetical protein [Candidatus Omnitrophota bacterium]